MKIWMDGKLVDREQAAVSVFDHGVLYGDGVFEGIRIYNGRIFQCTAHIDRLYESAGKIRLDIPYTKQQLVDAMNECIAVNGLTDNGYIRLVVTRARARWDCIRSCARLRACSSLPTRSSSTRRNSMRPAWA